MSDWNVTSTLQSSGINMNKQRLCPFLGERYQVSQQIPVYSQTLGPNSPSASRCSRLSGYKLYTHLGVSENVVYPIVPNGFADHYPY